MIVTGSRTLLEAAHNEQLFFLSPRHTSVTIPRILSNRGMNNEKCHITYFDHL